MAHEHDFINELTEFTRKWRDGSVTRLDAAEMAHATTGIWCEFEGGGHGPMNAGQSQLQATPELNRAVQDAVNTLQNSRIGGGPTGDGVQPAATAGPPQPTQGQPLPQGRQSILPGSQWSGSGQAPQVRQGTGGQPSQGNRTQAPSVEMRPPNAMQGGQPAGQGQPAGALNIQMLIQILMLILQNFRS